MDKIKASQFADLAYLCRYVPPPYQMVEYLESTGTQWIDTGIVPRETDYVFVDYQLNNITVADGTLFYIDNGAVGNNAYGLSTANYGGGSMTGYVLGWGGYSITNGPTYTLNTSRHTFGLCNGVFEYDETVWKTSSDSFVSGKKIYLPAWNRSGTPIIGGKTKIFQFSVFPSRNSTNAIIDLLPCYRKADNKPGFYDRVSGNFFVNIGTGEFAVGGTV